MGEKILEVINQLYDSFQDFYDDSGLTSEELSYILQFAPDGIDGVMQFQLCHALHLSMDKFAVGVVAPEEAVKSIQEISLEDVVGELIFRLHDQPATLCGGRIHPDVLDAFQNDLEKALTVARRRQHAYNQD